MSDGTKEIVIRMRRDVDAIDLEVDGKTVLSIDREYAKRCTHVLLSIIGREINE